MLVYINLALEIYAKLSSIWYIELCVGLMDVNVGDLRATQIGVDGEISIG